MKTISYKIGIGELVCKQEILDGLNNEVNLKATYEPTSPAKGNIVIEIPDDFSLEDSLYLGLYIGSIKTLKLVG